MILRVRQQERWNFISIHLDNKRRGFTLLELIAYVFIWTIISCAIATTILVLMKESKRIMDSYKNEKDIRCSIISIYTIASNDGIERVDTTGYELLLYGKKLGKDILNIVKIKNGNLCVDYYENKNGIYIPLKESTLILKEVEEFKVIKRGEILCLEIKRKGISFVKYI